MRKTGKHHGPITGPGRPPVGAGWDGNRATLPKITPRCLAIYRKMLAVAPDDSDAYDSVEDQLRAALRIPPWCWPTLAGPDEANAYPVGTGGHDWHPLAQALRQKLDADVEKRKAR